MVSEYTGWRKASYSNGAGQCVEVANWRKASYSDAERQCVETASGAGTVAVRDTTNRDGLTLTFSADTWMNFTDSLR